MNKIKLKLQIYGSPILRKKCRKVGEITPEILQILDKMVYLMRRYRGVGLAANQAGLDLALVVIETPEKLYKLINPKIIQKKGSLIFEEGCLSFPGLILSVKRAREVWVNFTDEQGRNLDLNAEDTLAVILQHEIDHIQGVLFIDRIPFWEKLKIKSVLKKIKNAREQEYY
ncbi:MAG: peptide deformylase [Candidatus Omnitrophica bacterium]|nr:peptide deformylase [Candidatus Omnitrophota bacterium]